MNFLPEEFEEILNIFNDESTEIIEKLSNHLVSLEKDPDNPQIINYLFQDAHSLKGAARMIGFFNIQNLAHKVEDILTLIKEGKIKTSQGIITTLCKTADLLMYLSQNSVKYKDDFYCDSIIETQKILDNIIKGEEISLDESNLIKEDATPKQNNLPEDFNSEIPNIKAVLLESILVLERYTDEEKEAHIAILYDNFVSLNEIFLRTNFDELKEKVIHTTNTLKQSLKNAAILNESKIFEINKQVREITDSLNKLFEENNIEKILTNYDEQENTSPEQNEEISEEIDKKSNKLKEKLEYLSGNISQIRYDESYIDNAQKHLLSLINEDFNEDIIKIYKKIYDILDKIKKLKAKPDSEIISVLTQSINVTQKVIQKSNDDEEEDLSLLLQRLSIVEQMIDINDTPSAEFSAPQTQPDPNQQFQKMQDFFKMFEVGTIKTLRVDTKKLDSLISQTGELIINGIKSQKHLSEIDQFNSKLTEWSIVLKKTINYIKYFDKKHQGDDPAYETINNFNRQILNLFRNNLNELNDLTNCVNELYKQVNEDDLKLNHIITEIENIVKSIRVLPLATIFHMFPRMIRDIAANSNKQVELLISGGDTSVDKKIIEEIKIPLIHILRNSIDHGIETPEERIKLSKDPTGKINLSARQADNKIIIEIEDDGSGINLHKIKEKAQQKGILTKEEISSMTNEQIMNLIFWPGFSTGDQITEISGRGIGLDIVQSKISQLNGKIKVLSKLNQGAKTIIELPVSMSTMKAFIISIADKKYAIPMNTIKTVLWLDRKQIFTKDGRHTILFDNQTIPIFDLASILDTERNTSETSHNLTTIVIEAENSKIAYVVDRLLGDQEILQKKLAPPIFKIKNVSGITTLASGEVCLILNVPELVKSTIEKANVSSTDITKLIEQKPHKKAKQDKFHILLVDDSKTTLTLLEKILVGAGYNVTALSKPQNAMIKLKQTRYDLIITDIKMPDYSGKELVNFIRCDENMSEIPIILISTLSTSKMQELFSEIKIQHYIQKLKFNKEKFLNKVSAILSKNKEEE